MTPPQPLATLATRRLTLRASHPEFAAAAADFHSRNRVPHARWNPPLPASMYTLDGQRERLTEAAVAIDAGAAISWWLFATEAPEQAIGQINFTQITRRAFQNTMLGYAMDHAHEGRGLMREALSAALADLFGPRVRLHRVQANVIPDNARSLGLLARLGFEREGLAREYLFIDGAWRDHAMMALRNPSWPADAAPQT